MTVQINEFNSLSGAIGPELTLLGQFIGYDGPEGSSDGLYVPLTLTLTDPLSMAKVPGSPALGGSVVSRTQQNLAWSAAVPAPSEPVTTNWEVENRQSTDNGVTFSAWVPVTGSPFAPTVLSSSRTGLPVGTPEIVFQWRVRGVNSVGHGAWSNVLSLQFGGAPVNQPTAPTGFAASSITETSMRLAWTETADPTVTKHGLFLGSSSTPYLDNLGATINSYDLTGLAPGTTLTNLSVKRFNGVWSPASNQITPTTLTEPPVSFTMLIGVNTNHAAPGGFPDWDLYRAYTENAMLAKANKTGSSRPKMLFYSKQGANYGGSSPVYTTVYNEVLADLESFYYTTGGAPSARANIKLVVMNGNENSDKGALSPAPAAGASHTDAQVANYLISQKAVYDACHYAPGGVRRYPNAFASSNPTQEQERKGWVEKWLHASARYHDIVVWSMYPPGRGVNDPAWAVNPRWDWPTFNEALYANTQVGFLIRCFRRTKLAQAQARIDTGDNTFKLAIGTGEVGIASNPNDRACRPYYAVHALFGAMWQLAVQFNLEMWGACWWDQRTSDIDPHNELDDEPTASDHLSAGLGGSGGNNTIATNPSTAQAIRNWMSYDKRQPGSNQPAQWNGFPRAMVSTQAASDETHWWVQYGQSNIV